MIVKNATAAEGESHHSNVILYGRVAPHLGYQRGSQNHQQGYQRPAK